MKIKRPVETISNEYLEFSFVGSTGGLVSVRNLLSGNEYLQRKIATGNPFLVYYGFFKEYKFYHASNLGNDDTGGDPKDISNKTFSPSADVTVGFTRKDTKGAKVLRIVYADTDGQWKSEITVSLKAGISSQWKMKLTNTGNSPEQFMGAFPVISGLQLGDGKSNMMVVNSQAGYIRPLWSHAGGVYGNSTQMSMQWGCVFDETTKEAFGLIVKDEKLKNKEIKYEKPSIQVRYFPPQTLNPGQSMEFPEAEIMVYTGDWKKTAVAYHKWFVNAFKPVKHAPWVYRMDSHLGQWFKKRGQVFPGDTEKIKGLANPMDSFTELPDVYRRLPIDTIEFAFFCRGSMGKDVTGKVFTHTDGDNIIREDLGGPSALKEGVKRVHQLGFHFTFYIDGYICPDDSEITLKGEAKNWRYQNKDGTHTGNYSVSNPNWMHMCPGSGWQDHLARTAARLVRETGADGVRLDSLGAYFLPCYNPLHKHKSPFNYNVWMCELLKKVAAAVKKVNPKCILTTELSVDFYSRYFDGSLTQQWGPVQIAVSRDIAPMRIALPEYFVMAHNPCGPVAASLMGYPGGSGGAEVTSHFVKLDEKWRSVMFTVRDIIRWGDAVYDNPGASRPDVVCRRFHTDGIDVIVGAYPRFVTDFSKYGDVKHQLAYLRNVFTNADVDLKEHKVSFQVRVDTAGKTPAEVYLYDVTKMTVKEVGFKSDGEDIVINLTSNWFVLIFNYGKSKPISLFDIQTVLRPGKTYAVKFSLLGAPSGKRFSGSLHAPGLGWSKATSPGLKVTVPGALRLTVPETTPKGKYPVILESGQFLGCKRFIEVG